MDPGEEKSEVEKLRDEISKKAAMLPDWKLIEIAQHYGITYDVPDVNTYRLFSLIASAEAMITNLRKEKQ